MANPRYHMFEYNYLTNFNLFTLILTKITSNDHPSLDSYQTELSSDAYLQII
jgi:hypothetical protein